MTAGTVLQRWCMVLVFSGLGATTAACGGDDAGAVETFSATGSAAIAGPSSKVAAVAGASDGDDCSGTGELGAFREGAEVLVFDADDTRVAVGELSRGVIPESAGELRPLGIGMCKFTFEVPDIPAGDGLFVARIGDDEVTFRQSEAGELEISGSVEFS